MKKIIFSLFLFTATVSFSFAQTNAPQKSDSTESHSSQVEFYSSMEAFTKKNPAFLIDLTVFVVVREVYTLVTKNSDLYKKEILASK